MLRSPRPPSSALEQIGTVAFGAATATAAGHTGTISDPAWGATAIALQGTPTGAFGRRFGQMVAAAGATPGDLSADGTSFSVAWAESAADPQPGDGLPGA